MGETITKYQLYFFNFIEIFTYITYIVVAFGIYSLNPKYFEYLNYCTKLYVSLFLLWRFNSFKTQSSCTYLDKKIAFAAGMFLFATTILHTYLINLFDEIIKNLQNKHILPSFM